MTSIGKYAFTNCKKLVNIEYAGTEEEWEKIEKGKKWNNSTGAYIVNYKKNEVTCEKAADGLMVYYEDFSSYGEMTDKTQVANALGWKILDSSGVRVKNDNNADYFIADGKLEVTSTNESYIMIKDNAYMKAAGLGNYTIQYDVEYGSVAKSDDTLYANLVYNFKNHQNYKSVHFRLNGSANNQILDSGKWYSYDKEGSEYYAKGNDKDTGSSAIYKLTSGEITFEDGKYPLLNRSITIKIQVSRDEGTTVWARDNTVEGAQFVCISKYDPESGGADHMNVIDEYAVCLKTRPNITSYIDNIAIWTGLGDMPTDHTTTAYETAIAGN